MSGADDPPVMSPEEVAGEISASLLSVDQLLDHYAEFASVVRPVAVSGIAPDADDDVVIGTAVAARADLIVTGEKPLLSVAKYDGGRIVSVTDALDLVYPR